MMQKMDYPGSRWWKFDFHNHTPASSDYNPQEQTTLSPQDWLLAYMRKEIDCVVICDHNCSDWIEKLQKALEDLTSETPKNSDYRPLTIFPGVEITTSEAMHILAIFAPETSKAVLDGLLLGKLEIPLSTKMVNAALLCKKSAVDIIKEIKSLKGIAIAAHAEKSKGLLETHSNQYGQEKLTINERNIKEILPQLDALECHDKTHTIFGRFSKELEFLAFVAGSDAHSINNPSIGKHFTWVKMSKPSLEGLKLALSDSKSSIRLSQESPHYPQPTPKNWIRSVTLNKLHLCRKEPIVLDFNPSYNGIIGGRGSGKSTILECLRLALGRSAELEKLGKDSEVFNTFEGFKREYTQRDKPGLMLGQTELLVEICKGEGINQQHLCYKWSKKDNKFQVTVDYKDQNGWQTTDLTEQQACDNFPIKIFSQKQILSLANNPQNLLEYIDSSIADQYKAWTEQFDKQKQVLIQARARLKNLRQELAEKPQIDLAYREANRKKLLLENSDFAPILEKYQTAINQRESLNIYNQEFKSYLTNLQSAFNGLNNLKKLKIHPDKYWQNTNALTFLGNTYHKQEIMVEKLSHLQQQVDSLVENLKISLDSQGQSIWAADNEQAVAEYRTESDKLKAQGIISLESSAQILHDEDQLSRKLAVLNDKAKELDSAEHAVEHANNILLECRQRLTTLRKNFIEHLSASNNADNTLKVTLECMANPETSVTSLRDILNLPQNDTFSNNIWYISDDSNECSGVLWDIINDDKEALIPGRIQELKQAIEEIASGSKQDSKVLNTKLRAELTSRIKSLASEKLDQLSYWFPEDKVVLEYKPKPKDKYKNLKLASAGQKTAAMLSFLLMHGDEPLILDQPEDDLDNALISELVVNQLRNNKHRRQLIIVTHNANIIVNADAELVIAMDFNGQITQESGSLQEKSVRQTICKVMEGGEEAFRQRYKRILEDLKA